MDQASERYLSNTKRKASARKEEKRKLREEEVSPKMYLKMNNQKTFSVGGGRVREMESEGEAEV